MVAGTSPATADVAPGPAHGLRTGSDQVPLTDLKAPPGVDPSGPELLTDTLRTLPNDPRRQNLSNVYGAWQFTHGSAAVKVAVIDTGIKTSHPDLKGKVVAQYNATTGSHTAPDGSGQGTAVASIIGANTGNGTGVSGVGWNTRLLDVRVSDAHGYIADAALARGIDWSVAHGASVINISLYQPESNSLLKAAVARAVSKNVVIVAMAGDFASTFKMYPAAYPGVVSVAAPTSTGLGPWGRWVDVSATPKAMAANLGNGYATVSGSAFAAPQVSGLAALLRAEHPEYTAAQVVARLISSASHGRTASQPPP